jgi:hypothetical protein
MNKQTAMQQLLAQLKNERANLPMDIEWDRCYQAIETVIVDIYLPIEKEQIENAYEEGYNRVVKLIEDATKINLNKQD